MSDVVFAGGNDPSDLVMLMESGDGTSWSTVSSPYDAGTSILGMAWNGSLWVAVGQWNAGHIVQTSPDGVTWTARTSPLDGTARGTSAIWDGSQWVVGVMYGASSVMTSPDGVTWTARSTPFDDTTGTWGVRGLAYDSGTYVALGQNSGHTAAIATSSDAATWTAQTNPFTTTGSGIGMCAVWTGSQWVAGGQDSGTDVILTSPDASTWTAQTTALDGGSINGLGWNGSLLVACGFAFSTSDVIMTSPDGVTWTARSSPLDGDVAGAVFWSATLGEWFVGASGSSTAVVATSSAGTTWTSPTTPFDSGGLVSVLASGPGGGGGGTTTTVTAADTLDGFHEAANVRSGPITVQPRPAVAGTGPAQTATPAGAGGIGGGVDLPMRIVAWDCTVADEGGSTLSFTLARPPPSKAPTPPALYFPQLIAQLQQKLSNVSTTISLPPLDGGGGGLIGVEEVTSIDGTVTVSNGAGPVVDLSVTVSGGGTGSANAIPFIFAGALTNSTSPPITPHATIHVTGLSATLAVTSASDVTVTLLRNGTSAASVTVPAGSSYAFGTFTAVTYTARTDNYALSISASDGANLGGEIELS